MSWFNLNDSLNSIKGQISNFANDVLADVPEEEELKGAKSRIQQLEELCATQKLEIENLRKLEAEHQDGMSNWGATAQNADATNTWEWDSFQNETSTDSQTVADLKKRIVELESAKRDLEANIDKLDLDCQQSIDKLIALKDDLQKKHDDLEEEHTQLLFKYERIENAYSEAVKELKELKAEKNALKISWDELKRNPTIAENNEEIRILKTANDELRVANTSLESAFEEYRKQSELSLSQNVEKASSLEEKLQENETRFTLISNEASILSNKVKNFEQEIERLRSENTELSEKIRCLTEENTELLHHKPAIILDPLQDKLDVLESENQNLKKTISELEECKKLETGLVEAYASNAKEMHERYMNILVKSMRKYVYSNEVTDLPETIFDSDPLVNEFTKQVENIMKLLVDFKTKTEAFEKELYEVREEHAKVIHEKNYEIEKLLKNSEILSQEVITKSQAVKDYEQECSELMKNNELLISELDNYKNSSGLQTISESNEDNMVLLESQLESANKHIKELESTLNDFEKRDMNLESSAELDYVKQQLNITGRELNDCKQNYSELLEKYNKLETENSNLKTENHECKAEQENLKLSIDKMNVEFENNEYQYAELNADKDNLKEEVDTCRKNLEDALQTKKKLEILNTELHNKLEIYRSQLDNLQQKLSDEEDTRKQVEAQLRSLTEKLQNSKMAETSLKFQLQVITEAKQNLDFQFNKLLSDVNLYQNEIAELKAKQEEYQRLSFEFERLKISNNELVQKNTELMQQLSISQERYVSLEEQFKDLNINETLQEKEDLINKLNESERKCLELQNTSFCPSNVEELIQKHNELLKQFEICEAQRVQLLNTLNQTNNAEIQQTQDMFSKITISDMNSMPSKASLVSLTTDSPTEKQMKDEYEALICKLRDENKKIPELESQISELTASRNELIAIVTTKHQESVTYHNEIQRLSLLLTTESEKSHNLELQLKNSINSEELQKKNEEIEKLIDQNNFLRQKCEVLAENLLQEQSKVQKILAEHSGPSEREQQLSKELERLKAHLIEREENYTQELLAAEEKIQSMQTKMAEIEEREKNSSTLYTSVNIRANQQVEALQSQIQMLTNQRDELRKRMSDAEDESSKQQAALANLQFVLEQFQKDREKDISLETERIRRQVNAERQVQAELRKEIANLKAQLEESRQGLQAAARLGDQLEQSKQHVSKLKEEVTNLQDKLAKSEEKYKNLTSQTDAKVDKTLIKNLVVGLVSANNNLSKDQMQVLKIIATVLDFNQQDHEKVNLNKMHQGSWLSSLLYPQNAPGGHQMSSQSLSEAFVRFLENESKPRAIPNLLTSDVVTNKSEQSSSKSNTPRQSPIVLNEVVLPTFSNFAQNRNSSSILKDVLKDNS